MKKIFLFCLAFAVQQAVLAQTSASGKIVLVDSYFNDEHKKDDATGKIISFHYKWDETDNNGFYIFGGVFNRYGFLTRTLYKAPTKENLQKASVYIIVDPDVPKENPDAKYIEEPDIKAITAWVKAGGVLIVLNNDAGNAEFKHLNNLMAKFGITYNEDLHNHVIGEQFEQGAVVIPADNAIFKAAKKIYIKDISTITVTAPAVASLADKDAVIIATAKYGKGTVFAVGDPWFYNEYVNGRLPSEYQNLQAADDLVAWIVKQLPKKENRKKHK